MVVVVAVMVVVVEEEVVVVVLDVTSSESHLKNVCYEGVVSDSYGDLVSDEDHGDDGKERMHYTTMNVYIVYCHPAHHHHQLILIPLQGKDIPQPPPLIFVSCPSIPLNLNFITLGKKISQKDDDW
ncbi:hypothetical protein E2C01_024104 [Portunus trituberculatus]|uniref:Uncharacterized protein n=1 Tax=Portunus trituberculatus TaxID=210409 RepID=A0A5B7EBU0_PORTR|nr:hypothetical protein [Portunus trituberculatus]